eukprot:6186427-Pleurochrysis_carterae.AAC.4
MRVAACDAPRSQPTASDREWPRLSRLRSFLGLTRLSVLALEPTRLRRKRVVAGVPARRQKPRLTDRHRV